MSKNLIIAIDGPAGSGKSTSAKLIAQRLGYFYIDTGAMYRAVTLMAIKKNVLTKHDEIIKLAQDADISLQFKESKTEVYLSGENITDEIRTQKVNLLVSDISKIEGVRKALVEKQQEIAKSGKGIVMEGRDIGTVVFPDADVKIFLTASIELRAKRRLQEFSGSEISFDEVKNNILQRDVTDSTRELSPLIKAPDAVEIDTSSYSIDEQVEIILNQIKRAASKKGIEVPL